MRARAIGLLALAGCNQIFGLNDPVGLVDAPVTPPDAALPTVRLTHLVAQTRVASANAKGIPDPVLQRPPLDNPMAKVGPLDGALVDAPYDMTTGQIQIPAAVFDLPAWRIQYRVDNVPHEVSWTTARDSEPNLVVPVFGRLPRTAPPSNSGYDLRPSGAAAPLPETYRASRVFTTGVFMDLLTGTSPSNTRVDTTTNKHLSGPIGTPDATAGDGGVVANYVSSPTPACEHLVEGYAEFFVPPLTAGLRTLPLNGNLEPGQPTWVEDASAIEQVAVTVVNVGIIGPGTRLAQRLQGRSEPSGVIDPDHYLHGIAASELIPILTPGRPLSFLKSNVLSQRLPPGPLMFLLAQCTITTTTMTSGDFIAPVGLQAYPRITYGVATNRRPVSGVELLSSLATVSKHDTSSVLDFGVPLAVAPITLSDGTTLTDLAEANDGEMILPAATFELDFTLEPDTGNVTLLVDYVEVTVFQLSGALIPRHVYVTANLARDSDGTLAVPIRIDGAALAPGGEYVFQIRAVRGAPNAALGDFETIAFPQAMATTFTRTFRVQ